MRTSATAPTPLLGLILIAGLLLSGATLARTAKPFKATIAVSEVFQPDSTSACPLFGDISGSGTASHMGKVALVSRDCVIPLSETAFSFASTQLVLTAANGDKIFATYSGTLTVEGDIGTISGGYQITGGTGRFVGANGAGTVQGLENVSGPPPFKGHVQLNGSIAY
jgi:hypothetical protein